ncbi:MAG: zinc-binding dehydrogenase [Candidatus Dormibacteraceae bacterium]
MRAIISTPDGAQPVEFRDVAEPEPRPNELLIEVEAASVNRGELALLQARPNWGPGQDVAGTVARAAADGSGPAVGARVTGMADWGGWAERVAVPTHRVGVLPDTVAFTGAATFGVAGMTALRALRAGGSLLDARVLVTGAAGGVGTFAVQFAALAGAQVTASVGSLDRQRRLGALGAARTVLDSDALEGPYDIVLEGVGGASLERSVGALAPGGVVELYGATAPEPARLALASFRGTPHCRIEPFLVYQTGEETFGRDLSFMARLVAEGRLQPQIGLEVSWTELTSALEALRDRRVEGKVVLHIG